MQLLVSVRAGAEVEAALFGGADIVDAKEPSRGSMGPVSPDVLADIMARVPMDRAVSIALGDVACSDDVLAALSSVPRSSRKAPVYLKFGFAGVSSSDRVRLLLDTALVYSGTHLPSSRIVAVAYADTPVAGSAAAPLICRAAAIAGAAGMLIDTYAKDGRNLLTWMQPANLAELVASAHVEGLLVALAGGLGHEHLRDVIGAGPDIVGIRGAACVGGRGGQLCLTRVQELRCMVDDLASRCFPEVVVPGGCETPEAGRISGRSS